MSGNEGHEIHPPVYLEDRRLESAGVVVVSHDGHVASSVCNCEAIPRERNASADAAILNEQGCHARHACERAVGSCLRRRLLRILIVF